MHEFSSREVFFCRARGRFRSKGVDLLVGDIVKITQTGTKEAVIEDVLPRRNRLLRPPVANADQAVILTSVEEPPMDLFLLDRIVVSAEAAGLDVTVCFNKSDLLNRENLCQEKLNEAKEVYKKCNYNVIITSALFGDGLEELSKILQGKVNVMTGPSGVGKSTLINELNPKLELEAAPVTRKTKRGKHTTRHVELLTVDEGFYVVDTPGFQKLNLNGVSSENLASFFPEISLLQSYCYFNSCFHNAEPGCAVKEAVQRKEIASWRHNHYLAFLHELYQKENIR